MLSMQYTCRNKNLYLNKNLLFASSNMNDLLKCVDFSETPLVLYDCIPRMNVVANVSWPLTSAFDCLIAQGPLLTAL